MRSPGVIYRRYRQLRKRILYDKLQDAKKCRHDNCHYGKTVIRANDDVGVYIKLCTFGVNNGEDADICTNAWECNAFVNKWTKEAVAEKFYEEMNDPKVKRDSYPELMAYEWVLDKSLTDAMIRPNMVGKLIVYCIKVLENLLKFVQGPQKNLMDGK